MVQDNLSTKEHIDPFKGQSRKSLDTVVSFHKPLEGLVKYRPLQGSLKTARFTCGLLLFLDLKSVRNRPHFFLFLVPFSQKRKNRYPISEQRGGLKYKKTLKDDCICSALAFVKTEYLKNSSTKSENFFAFFNSDQKEKRQRVE